MPLILPSNLPAGTRIKFVGDTGYYDLSSSLPVGSIGTVTEDRGFFLDADNGKYCGVLRFPGSQLGGYYGEDTFNTGWRLSDIEILSPDASPVTPAEEILPTGFYRDKDGYIRSEQNRPRPLEIK